MCTSPCKQCPWLRTSAPGWLGASSPGEFLQQADHLPHMPCHAVVDYTNDDWRTEAAKSPQCRGRLAFLANRGKVVIGAPKGTKLDEVFTWPYEFISHHMRVPPETMSHMLIYDLYQLGAQLQDDED